VRQVFGIKVKYDVKAVIFRQIPINLDALLSPESNLSRKIY